MVVGMAWARFFKSKSCLCLRFQSAYKCRYLLEMNDGNKVDKMRCQSRQTKKHGIYMTYGFAFGVLASLYRLNLFACSSNELRSVLGSSWSGQGLEVTIFAIRSRSCAIEETLELI